MNMDVFMVITIVLIFVILYFGLLLITQHSARVKQSDKVNMERRADMLAWQEERRQLMDRIHSNSHSEYKSGEIKLEKAKRQLETTDAPLQPL